MSMGFSNGHRFTTGNSTVKQLKVGTILEVVGPGQVEIIAVAVSDLVEGSRFNSKYGPATVVRVTSTYELDTLVEDAIPENSVVYVADGTNVVRVTSQEFASGRAL